MRTVRMSIPDMACGGCVAAIEAALEAVEGVDVVEVSLEERAARIRVRDDLPEDALVRAVTAAGYAPEL